MVRQGEGRIYTAHIFNGSSSDLQDLGPEYAEHIDGLRIPDLARIRQAIDYQPRYTLEDIVREVVDWKRAFRPGVS